MEAKNLQIRYKVIASPTLRIRKEADINSTIVGTLHTNDVVTVTVIKNDSSKYTWGKHSLGWSSIVSPNGHVYMEKIEVISGLSTTTTPVPTKASASVEPVDTAVAVPQATQVYDVMTTKKFELKTARSIMGLPAQFLNTTDPRVPGSAFGRSFTENILMDIPLCTIIPGGPKFLTSSGISDKQRDSLLKVLLGGGENSGGSALSSILESVLGGKYARYYSFMSRYTDYMDYVNTLNRELSFYLGIQDKTTINGTPYKKLRWQDVNVKEGNGIQNLVGMYGGVSFYYDKGGTGSSESASNSTDRSMLDGVLQGVSSTAKEAAFITQAFAGKKFDLLGSDSANINNLTAELVNSNTMIQQIMANLKSGFTTIATGSNLMLPEIWKDSSFSRSYSLDFHFATPYGTPEAYYLNVGVPMNFLLPLVLPIQYGPNGYSAPFIVQVFAQGLFNCSLGIVDQMTITKFGSGDAVSRDHLPLEIKISISFRDLYSSLAITKNTIDENLAMFANNIELIDYIGTMAGVNLNEPDIERKLKMFVRSKFNAIRDIPGNIVGHIYDSVRNQLSGLLKY